MEAVNSNQPRNKGFIRGSIAAGAMMGAGKLAASTLVFPMQKAGVVNSSDKATLRTIAQDVLEKTKLAQKGVSVVEVKEACQKNSHSFKEFLQKVFDVSQDKTAVKTVQKELLSNKNYKKFYETLKKSNEKEANETIMEEIIKFLSQFKMGLNAAFLPNTNKILLPENNLQTSVFQEIGHAMNANFGTISKHLQKIRGISNVVPAFVVLASLLNSKKQGEKRTETETPVNPIKKAFVKTGDFIKDNALLLTGLSFVPGIIEEGLATLKGQKTLKAFVENGKLSKDLMKQIKKTNAFGFASYVAVAVLTMLASKAAIGIKDKIQDQSNFTARKSYNPLDNKVKGHQG